MGITLFRVMESEVRGCSGIEGKVYREGVGWVRGRFSRRV